MKRFLAILFLFLLHTNLFALESQVPAIQCDGVRGQFVLRIIDQKLSVQNNSERTPASVPTLINRLRGKSLTQVTYIDGERYKIFIENVHDLKTSSNTFSKRSRRGHEMTYPLNCKNLN